MKFPIFINEKNRYRSGLLLAVAAATTYLIPNHFHIFTPKLLPLFDFEKNIKLVDWTILIYTSEYYLFATAYVLFSKDLTRNKYFWSFVGVSLLSAVIFVFFPTTYPRADYPISENVSGVVGAVFAALRATDDPSNCLPSLHVTCCYLTSFAFLDQGESRKKFWAYFLWATAVAVSTLTTKQHYILDVIAGLLLSWGAYLYWYKKASYYNLKS